MAFCKQCGNEIEAGAGFCVSCGTPTGNTENKSQAEPEQDEGDKFKTRLRKKPVYGVVNLEDLPRGHVIDDRYEVKEKLGQGGFGAVYKAYDKKMEIDKALKVLPTAIVNDMSAMNSIKAEATTMVRLDHPNIVRVFDFQDKGDIKYIDMQFVDGRDLTKIRFESEAEKLSEAEVKKYARQIATGLAYAHANNVIHKDIKPQNILVSTADEVKIMDFGISETVKSSMSRVENSSSSGTLVYMSPEQIRGKNVGKEADIYSFGAMLYELLSGRPPFYKGAIEHQILNEKPDEIDGISNALNAFLQKCLAKDYSDRYRNFDEVIDALNGKAVSAKKTSSSNPETKANRWKLIVPVGVVLFALTGFLISGGLKGKSAVEIKEPSVTTMAVTKRVAPVAVVEKPAENESSYKAEIKSLDLQIRDMKKRLETGMEKTGDSLAAMQRLIGEKTEKKKQLSLYLADLASADARNKEAAREKEIVQLKADIKAYQDVIASEYGKDMEKTAWVRLAKKYPKRSEGVDAGDTTTLLYGFSVLNVKASPSDAAIKILNISDPFRQGIKLKGGNYRLKVSASNYLEKELEVNLTPGKTKNLEVSLVKYPRLYVTTEPAGAKIKLLNLKAKYKKGMKLKPGSYTIEVSAEKRFTKKVNLKLDAGDVKKVEVKLDRGFVNSNGMTFVYIKPGSFNMGSSNGDSDAKPVHGVTLSKGFYMQTTELTQGQWQAVMGKNPSSFKNCDDCPVENVSWNDAKEFISKLNSKEGVNKYRLPTEAEWEYACRAGSDTDYANGNSLDTMGWYAKNSGSKTHSVGQKKANAWGLYDMYGNVWEWCEDWYGKYPSGNVSDTVGPSEGSFRVIRGGCWVYSASFCRSANRSFNSPGFRYYNLGFRLARTP